MLHLAWISTTKKMPFETARPAVQKEVTPGSFEAVTRCSLSEIHTDAFADAIPVMVQVRRRLGPTEAVWDQCYKCRPHPVEQIKCEGETEMMIV